MRGAAMHAIDPVLPVKAFFDIGAPKVRGRAAEGDNGTSVGRLDSTFEIKKCGAERPHTLVTLSAALPLPRCAAGEFPASGTS